MMQPDASEPLAPRRKEPKSVEGLPSHLGKLTQSPLLSAEEELALSRAALAGDREARERLIQSNMRLVINIARTYSGGAMPLEDLIQEGAIGLVRAVERFDPSRGFRFSTYATHWIRQSIRRALDSKAKTIRLPSHVTQAIRRIERERERVQAEEGRDPSPEEIAGACGINVSRLKQILPHSAELLSLDMQVGSADGTTLGSLLKDPGQTPEDAVLTEEMLDLLEEAINELTEREQLIVRRRLSGDDSAEFRKDLSENLGLGMERVRQIEMAAIRKLRVIARQRQWVERPDR